MPLPLSDVRRIAAEVARQQDAALEVVSATPTGESSTYAEVILTIRGCRQEPCRVLLGVSRDASEGEVRRDIAARLREHLAEHEPITQR